MDATAALIQELNGLKEIIGDIASRRIFFINSLHNSHLNLRAPISVSLEYDGYQFIAYAPDLDIYGCGDSEYEAMEDLRESIVELYFDLKEEALGSDLQKIWEYLKLIITENEN
ncbi:hypothetical protein H8E77_30170 [bacterium]|nr:hypothetical protein [bacterium]